jgi:ribosomal protein S18 acetylase RimI-like enzyme
VGVCEQVEVECPRCGHSYVAVPDGEASCAECGHELSWTEVRTARSGDVEAVLELWETARSEHATTEDSKEVVERLLDADPSSLLVAAIDGRVVGALIATWDGWRGHLYRLAIAPERRRRGIGLALVREGERRLRDRGAPKVIAPVGRSDERAEGLWAAAGYELDATVGRWQHVL